GADPDTGGTNAAGTTARPRANATPPGLMMAGAGAALNVRTNAGLTTNGYRLSNTAKSMDELSRMDAAILLRNAVIDTSLPVNLPIPAHLRAQGDPGSYVVQARGPLTDAYRALLRQAGAEIVSYVPNN